QAKPRLPNVVLKDRRLIPQVWGAHNPVLVIVVDPRSTFTLSTAPPVSTQRLASISDKSTSGCRCLTRAGRRCSSPIHSALGIGRRLLSYLRTTPPTGLNFVQRTVSSQREVTRSR